MTDIGRNSLHKIICANNIFIHIYLKNRENPKEIYREFGSAKKLFIMKRGNARAAQIQIERLIELILITKDEAMLVREKCPWVSITRTCIQKSKRHRYYMTEDFSAMKLLNGNSQAQEILKERYKSRK